MATRKKSTKSAGAQPKHSERIFWQEGGVHQNLTFPVHRFARMIRLSW